VNSAGALVVEVPFDHSDYQSATDERWIELLIDMLAAGISKAGDLLPGSELLQAMEAFRDSGCVNEWIHKQRIFKSEALVAELHCALNIHSFVLRLRVRKDRILVFDQVIRETTPDETIFRRELNDVKIVGDEMQVLDKAGAVLFSKQVVAFS
jgi:hypothetical protein